jgi:hypothetical protein
MSHGFDEPYTVYRCERVTARKEHRCCACGETIRAGHRYSTTFAVWDGSGQTYKRCLRCDVIFQALVVELRGTDEWPDEDLNCGHEWTENLGIPLPPHVARLAFISADEAQRELANATPAGGEV